MSRIAKNPVEIPEGVEVTVNGQSVTAKGKLGTLDLVVSDDITVRKEDNTVVVEPKGMDKNTRSKWGTFRSLIANMVEGVSQGYTKKLIIAGVGYRAAVQGKELVMQLGFSHEVRYPIPEGIQIKCEKPTDIEVSGFDKQKVGQVAAEIYNFRPPEPYKGKGISYEGQRILRKEGKKK